MRKLIIAAAASPLSLRPRSRRTKLETSPVPHPRPRARHDVERHDEEDHEKKSPRRPTTPPSSKQQGRPRRLFVCCAALRDGDYFACRTASTGLLSPSRPCSVRIASSARCGPSQASTACTIRCASASCRPRAAADGHAGMPSDIGRLRQCWSRRASRSAVRTALTELRTT